jgi:thiol-disulfide isomerase/thioredoxin
VNNNAKYPKIYSFSPLFAIFLAVLLVFYTTPSYSQIKRKVLVEEFTGMWCGDCPNGRTATEHLEATFGNSVICIAMHSSDTLATPYSEGAVNDCNVTEFPLGFIDRASFHAFGGVFQEIGLDGTDWDAEVKDRLNTSSPLEVKIANNYNNVTRELKIEVSADFYAAYSGNMRLNCILVEDSIPSNSAQRNSNNQNSASPWFQQGDPIKTYFQRDVARLNVTGNQWGDDNIIPVNVLAGQNFSKQYSCSLPSKWNDKHIKIVAFVSNWGTSSGILDTSAFSIINSEIARINPMLLTGMPVSAAMGFQAGKAYPNPSCNTVSFPLQLEENIRISAKIYNVLGVEIANLCAEELAAGEHTLIWPGTLPDGAPASNGLYICKITSSKGSFSRPVLLNR